MVSAADVKDLALVPVRGTVFVVKLPFVLVWMVLAYTCTLLYSIVAKIVRSADSHSAASLRFIAALSSTQCSSELGKESG